MMLQNSFSIMQTPFPATPLCTVTAVVSVFDKRRCTEHPRRRVHRCEGLSGETSLSPAVMNRHICSRVTQPRFSHHQPHSFTFQTHTHTHTPAHCLNDSHFQPQPLCDFQWKLGSPVLQRLAADRELEAERESERES